MSVITNKWNDGSGDSINIESPSFQGNQTVKISSPVQKGTSKRSMKFIGKCKKDSSKQVILTVEQEASVYTYDLILSSDNTEIAAKGGTANITAVLKTYRNSNLVSTDNVTPVLSGSATGFSISGIKVTGSNRTTTVGSRRSIVVTGKYSNTFDGQTVSSTITIYQEANEASYGTLTGGSVLASDIPASGGTSSTSISNMSQTISYTSGSTRAGTVTYSKTSEITVSSLGTTVKARTKVGQVTVTYTGEGSVTANKTVDIYQAANAIIDDNYDEHLSSYGTPEMVIISNQITAAGGTARAAGVVRNTYTYYNLYTSGSTVPYTRTKDGVYKIEMIGNGNNRFSMDDTYLITHSSMGTNVTTDIAKFRCYNESDRTKYVDDSISVSNRIESYNYGSWNIAISANPTTIAASGGTSTITASCTRTKTPVYTSGSTGTATTESATPTLAISGTGFTLSGTTVTASKNNVAARTATIIASYSGATSKSVTITQSAGPDGIGYMQIEGNDVDHYIFQVGRTPNTRSNDVQTLSEEPAEVATETKSESLFAKIKRIVTNLN